MVLKNISPGCGVRASLMRFLNDTLSIEDEKLFKACSSVHSSVPQSHYKCDTPHPKCENFNTLSQLSH